MRPVIILAKCLSASKTKPKFHFNGTYQGQAVTTIHLTSQPTSWVMDEDYALYVKVDLVDGGVMTGAILRSSPLNDLRN